MKFKIYGLILGVVFIACVLVLWLNTSFSFAPLGVPNTDEIVYPNEQPASRDEMELGKTLFFDNRLSINYSQSCATCHNPDLGFGDGLKLSRGAMGRSTPRNAPHIYNLAWNNVFFWDGRAGSMEEQALGPIQAEGEMNMPLHLLAARLKKVPYYQMMFTKVYGADSITPDTIAKAVAAFERTIIVQNTPFDQYLRGNDVALGPEAKRGLAIFEGKANCIKCHDGANLTDESFHNIGLKGTDEGRNKIVAGTGMVGAFKTAGLRNVLLTGPYMHDGSMASLQDVVQLYNRGGDNKENVDKLIVPLNLTDEEVNDLIAFLGALTEPLSIARPEIPEYTEEEKAAIANMDMAK